MKRKHSLLALCLFSMGMATAQTNSNTYSSTTTTSTYNATPATTDTTNAATSTSNMNNNSSMMNSNATTNTTAAPAYGTTTTTTTTYNADANTATTTRQDGDDKAWGKEGKFGVYAGVNFSRFVNEPIPDGAYRAGWQAGIYGRTGGTVFGQIGLEYRNSTTNLVRSGAGQPTPTPGNVSGQINQHFVAIPAYVGLRIGSALGLRIQAGAELSALVVNPNNRFGIGEDDFNRTILNGLVGAGINLGPLTLDAVYNHGLQNVFDTNDTKRNILALNLGFRF
ncbi:MULTISPECIES: PorT family protein [Spirosoma]|nr:MULTISPECIES: PorT family protein [Spirosoma]